MKLKNPREALVRLVTFLGGIYFVLEFVLPQSVLEASGVAKHHEAITNGFLAAIYVSIGLGIINLLMGHGSKILFRRAGAAYSAILLTGLTLMIGVSGLDWLYTVSDSAEVRRVEILSLYARAIVDDAASHRVDVPPIADRIAAFIPELKTLSERLSSVTEQPERSAEETRVITGLREAIGQLQQSPASTEQLPALAQLLGTSRSQLSARLMAAREQRLSRRIFSLLFNGVFTSLGSSMFALLAFYIAAAASRAFRIQSLESFLMMVAALLVILGQTSVGLMISESFGTIRLWLLEVPSAGVFRAIKLGAGVASLVLCFRMWFSIEAKSFTGGTSGG